MVQIPHQNKSTEYAQKRHAVSKSHANSTQLNQNSSNFVSPRNNHDYTDIMGYKNIDMNKDVDASYMLKGSNNTNTSKSKSK